MAKKRQNPQNQANTEKKDIDLELITHKYARYFCDSEKADKEAQNLASHIMPEAVREDMAGGEEDTSYIHYDTKRVYYPYYKTKIHYQIAKELPLHPILEGILHIIESTQKMQGENGKSKSTFATLKAITQLDEEIFHSIVADLELKGYIDLQSHTGELRLTNNGKEILQKAKERVVEETSAYVITDGIFGNVQASAKSAKDESVRLEHKPDEESFELKPDSNKRLRLEGLSEFFNDEKTLTLRQILLEGLRGLDVPEDSKDTKKKQKEQDSTQEDSAKSSQEKTESKIAESSGACEVLEITDIAECKKFFKSYVCLFYKNASKGERILVLDEKYDIDKSATQLFENLIDTSKFNANKNKAFTDNVEKFNALESEEIQKRANLELDISEGKILEVGEHKDYFLYALKNAKECVCIHSPWVRANVLEGYQKELESTMARGVKVCIKYGLKPRNKLDKAPIDEESRVLFTRWSGKYPKHFISKTDNSHEKILICDSEFMIVGSFNWLSFAGVQKENEELRKESSSIVRNKDSIQKQREMFN
ncbi:hypothetical protein [Campylobacter helveticus]|uniref:hypothetical protein n=2 Tax=Campylobacter helveticus TaxID=28898 RepID=UPI0022EB2865|nr:hypothetical protein [Campylobacter helveticus]